MPAKFHLPDFVRHFKLNMILLEMLNRQPEIFYDGVGIWHISRISMERRTIIQRED